MGKLFAVLVAVKDVLKKYPAMSAALVNFGVFAAGYFGLHITADQLVAAVGVLDVLFGIIVHSNVVPLAKVNQPVTVTYNGPTSNDPVPVQTVHEAIVPMEGKR